ncbi:MAG TPA: TIGR01777 family oxidoreductase [bacterium]|nr:TIGR01777 family oxidoreductase [bacterium]
MAVFEKQSQIEVPVKELFNWHNRPQAFERLNPPWEKVKVVEKKGGIQQGGRMVLEVKQGPFRRRWVAVHGDYIEGTQFVDEQVQGPFAKWVHTHQMLPETATASLLKDHIEYRAPLGFLGQALAGGYIRKRLEKVFAFRHTRTQNDLKRYHPYAGQPPLKIVVSGASGLIGTALTNFLSCAGNQVQTLVRRPPKPGRPEIFWDPYHGELDKTSLESLDVAVHLAGENIGAGRWTGHRKESILKSRVEGTRFLSEALASLKHPPKVFICSSAVGFYGNRGEETLTEESAPGQGFLAEVCRAWEGATEPARKAGIRVVNVRTGIVLTSLGGALAKMLTPFQMGLGGVIGTGNQWMSWISLEDLVGIYHYLIHTEGLSGPVNATAPRPVTNREFTRVLGKVLGRPTLFPLPEFMVKNLFGEMGKALLLEGQNVQPAKLTSSGFSFLYPFLEPALRWELGK